MRHRIAHRKLGRTSEHRLSLLRNLASSLIVHERIRTTAAKAKELRPFVEKLITLGKRDTLHARRRALSIIPHKAVVRRLFGDVSPRFSDRPGGYTRILKLGPRKGDGAEMAFIELVDFEFKGAEVAPTEAKSASSKAKKKDAESDASDDASEKKKPAKKKKTKAKASE